jgi:putative addiction module component (TIGR02574 family)
MSTTAEEVLKEALQLSEHERARLAAELLASLDPDVETRDGEAWIAEVERRAQAAIGGVPGLTWDETRTRVEETEKYVSTLPAHRTIEPLVKADVS